MFTKAYRKQIILWIILQLYVGYSFSAVSITRTTTNTDKGSALSIIATTDEAGVMWTYKGGAFLTTCVINLQLCSPISKHNMMFLADNMTKTSTVLIVSLNCSINTATYVARTTLDLKSITIDVTTSVTSVSSTTSLTASKVSSQELSVVIPCVYPVSIITANFTVSRSGKPDVILEPDSIQPIASNSPCQCSEDTYVVKKKLTESDYPNEVVQVQANVGQLLPLIIGEVNFTAGSFVHIEEDVTAKAIIVLYMLYSAMAFISILILLLCFDVQKGEMKKRKFSFVIYQINQLKVTVKPPERLNPKKKVHHDWLCGKQYYDAKRNLQMIQTIDKLLTKVDDSIDYIDLKLPQQNIGVWITIVFPLKSKPLAVVHVQQGAQLCAAAGYEHKLLGFIKHGLMNSMKENKEYVIPVAIEKKRRNNNVERSEDHQTDDENQIENITVNVNELTNSISTLRSMRLKLVRNLFKIKQKTNLIEHVEEAIEKKLEKNEFDSFATKIPVLSTIFGLYFGAVRAGKGDIPGAIGDILSGVLADIPAVGTTLSLAVDTAIIARDIANEVKQNEKLINHLTDETIKDLEEENKMIILKIKKVQPDSQIFGDSENCVLSDESHLGYTDDVSKIHIKSNDFIVCIQIEYRFGGKTACLDGNEGTLKTMVLGVNEKITSVQVSSDGSVLSSLMFHTDMGNEEGFGKEGKNMMSYELTNGHYIGGIKVYTGDLDVNNLRDERRIVRAISFTAKF